MTFAREISIPVVPDMPPRSPSAPKLLDRVRQTIRLRHYSRRTEQAYLAWIRRFIVSSGTRHPQEMGEPEITAFLSKLAARGVAASNSESSAQRHRLPLRGRPRSARGVDDPASLHRAFSQVMSMQLKRYGLFGFVTYAALALVASSAARASQAPNQREVPPAFQDYGVQIANIRNPRLDLKSHPIGNTFRTVLRRGVRENGANFAGWYSVVEWGCGSNCRLFAIVDLRNGRIYHNREFVLARGAQYRADSALFVANPRYPDAETFLADIPVSYWVWKNRILSCLYPSSACKNLK
jgi:hypothetical protein